MRGGTRRARRIVPVVASVLMVASVLLGLGGTAVAASAAPVPSLAGWQVRATLALGTDHADVDCASATGCWALESGHLLSSADGGLSWADRTGLVPAGVPALTALDCVSPQRCFLAATDPAGAAVVLLLDHGTVTVHPVPGAPGPLSSVSCATAVRCVGVTGGASFRTTDGGATWTQGSLGRPLLGEPVVDCVAATQVCYAVGNYGLVPILTRSADGGRTWTLQQAPWDDGGVYGLSCATVSDCVATGANYYDYALVVHTTDAGQHWTFASVPTHAYPLRSASCVSATRCTAIGSSPANTPFVVATTDGQHWTDQPVPAVATDVPAEIACTSDTSCSAVAAAQAFATSDAGTTWQSVPVPAAVEAPGVMDCVTPRNCVAAGTDAAQRPYVLVTADGGTSWSPAVPPQGGGRPSAVDCPTTSVCYALAVVNVVGSPKSITQLWASSDGGRSWAVRLARTAGLGGLSCPDVSTCLLSGYDGRYQTVLFRTTDGGAHLQRVTPPTTATVLGAVCTAVDACVIVGGTYSSTWTAYTTADLGLSYQPHALPSHDWFAFDCAGTFCMVGGANGGLGAIATSTDGGVTWTDATVPPQAQLISSVSCGSASACAAGTYDFDYRRGGARVVATRDAGAHWQVFTVPARHEAPIALACARARCVGSDYSPTGNPIIVRGPA